MEDSRMSERFNWLEAAETVVVPEQAAIAVYINVNGGIVIRQDGGWPDEDNIVIVAPLHAEALAQAILEAAGVYSPSASGPADGC
jgi:hypothetical protein